MDMNLASSSESDPNKRYRKTKPRVGMIFLYRGGEYVFYLVDFNTDEKTKEAFRIKLDLLREYTMCLLGSTFFIFASGVGDSNEYKKLDDASRPFFKSSRSVFSLDLSTESEASLQTLPDLLWSKECPVAIPTPKKNGDILVFSRTLISTPDYESSGGYSDFEVYNPLTGTRRALPGLYQYLVNTLCFTPDFIYMVASYAFLDDRWFFVKVLTVLLTIDLEEDQGWQPYETPVLVNDWAHFHRFHDFWLTAEEGFYLLREGPMFKEGSRCPIWFYDDRDDGCDDDDDGGGGDDVDYRDFGFPFSSDLDVHSYPCHPLSTLVGDSSLCTVRSAVKMRTHLPQIIVDLFEFDLDKLRSGYDHGGCKLVSSVELNLPVSYRYFEPIALCAIDDDCPIAT